MIFGIGLTVVGYAILYWGLHHFCGVDCPKNLGGGCHCRYSLITLLGLDKFGITQGTPVQFAP
jgi:hypothetical protein